MTKTKKELKEKWERFKYCVLDLSKGEKIAWRVLGYVWAFIIGAVIAFVV